MTWNKKDLTLTLKFSTDSDEHEKMIRQNGCLAKTSKSEKMESAIKELKIAFYVSEYC